MERTWEFVKRIWQLSRNGLLQFWHKIDWNEILAWTVLAIILIIIFGGIFTGIGSLVYFTADKVQVNLSVAHNYADNTSFEFRINDKKIPEGSYIRAWGLVRVSVINILSSKEVDSFDIQNLLDNKDILTYGYDGQLFIYIKHSDDSFRKISINTK